MKNSENSALLASQAASVKKPDMGQLHVSRRSYGTYSATEHMALLTNYFHLCISSNTKIYKYNVAIEGLLDPNVSDQNQEDTAQVLDTKGGSSSKTQTPSKGSKKKQPVQPVKETSKPRAERKPQPASGDKI